MPIRSHAEINVMRQGTQPGAVGLELSENIKIGPLFPIKHDIS